MLRQRGTPSHDRRQRTTLRRTTTVIGILAVTLLGGPCDGGGATASSSSRIAGVPFDPAPDSARVDVAEPTRSRPTSITNPLFPVSKLAQVVQLGEDGGKPLRVEVTLLPDTKTIDWNGQKVETLVSQYVAYLDGRILEVALDYFAQADDGSVWYFGENVDNYRNGRVVDHEGTWLAGKNGPPGMIMPANPKIGDVYRPENVPGLVFEEVTVKSVNETVDGPRGPVKGAVLVQEHLMDGTIEDKAFAPGYGEFRARAGDELLTVALAVPFDRLPGSPPAELSTLSSGAADIFDTASLKGWERMSATLDTMAAAWRTHRAGGLPELLDAQMTGALNALAGAVDAQNPAGVRQAAVDLARAGLDLQLRHRPPAEVDLARLGLWARQLLVDAAADDSRAVAGDVAALTAIWSRVDHTIHASNAESLNAQLGELRAAADDVTAAAAAVPGLLKTLADLQPA
ncbi:MAG: hypothetical protein ACRDYX_08625 [Egibacteraceae bacterium]